MVLPPNAADALNRAAAALRAGLVVAIPTDTVYGLAASLASPEAVARLFEAKRRPPELDLPVLVSDVAQALRQAAPMPRLPVEAAALMARFWPGPLTIVLPRSPEMTADLGGDGTTVGLRCPDHATARALCSRVGPLASTSANRHGQSTPETAAGVADALGDEVSLVIDGGLCVGRPSTVVDCTTARPTLLREGRLAWSEVQAAL